ncbi:hypothetical protein Taro_023252 [Colocasia esculenta]|uniref:Uncharacterized protein n=1 Tax=Colocasia esculenta TaxID=4460 RepID=A0A843V5X5_COLES|nr:hypothetical protein [Colocasia esculenta]
MGVLYHYHKLLDQVGLLHAVVAALYSYPCHFGLLQALVERFNRRFNTFGVADGETCLDLWALHRVSGLPIFGQFYEEVCLNDLLRDQSTGSGSYILSHSFRYLMKVWRDLARCVTVTSPTVLPVRSPLEEGEVLERTVGEDDGTDFCPRVDFFLLLTLVFAGIKGNIPLDACAHPFCRWRRDRGGNDGDGSFSGRLSSGRDPGPGEDAPCGVMTAPLLSGPSEPLTAPLSLRRADIHSLSDSRWRQYATATFCRSITCGVCPFPEPRRSLAE